MLGAVDKDAAAAVLTPLGVGLLAGHLRELGATVPTLDQMLEETAEVVVVTATGSPPETAAGLMRAWCARNPATASSELRALAERTDDPNAAASPWHIPETGQRAERPGRAALSTAVPRQAPPVAGRGQTP